MQGGGGDLRNTLQDCVCHVTVVVWVRGRDSWVCVGLDMGLS